MEYRKLEIRFSNYYPKLRLQTEAQLLSVKIINIDNSTPKEFFEYDTTMSDGKCFKLKDGKYLLLCFLGNKLIPFTTARRFTEEKKYYKENINKVFEISITRKEKK